MEQTNHHDSEQDPFWESDWPPNLAHAGVPSVPDVLLPTVLARLGLNHAPFSAEPSIEELVTALDDPAWQVRTAAIQALGSLDEPVPIEPLVAALDDEDLSVRAAAIWAIGGLDEQAPVDRLLTALHDSEWLVREMAAMTLGTLGERVPAELLLTALRDTSPFVSRAAALALAQTHPEVVSVLAAQTAIQQPATPTTPTTPATPSRPRLLHLAGAGLAALLLVSMFFTWLAFAQQFHPSSFHQRPSTTHAGAIIFTYRADQGVVGSAPMWPSDSKYLALLSSFGYSVQVWDMATGTLTQNLLLPVPYGGFNTISAMSWSPNGRYLAITSEDSSSRDAAVQVWDALTGSNTLDFHGHAALGIVCSGLLIISFSC